MTTHIFLALGMWDEVVSQNIVAAGADQRARWRPGHYTSWLGYGLLQLGRVLEARELLDLVAGNTPPAAGAGARAHLLTMLAHQAINDPWFDLASAPTVRLDGLGPMPPAMMAYARGSAALGRGDRQRAERELEQLRDHAARGQSDAAYAGSREGLKILELQLQALLRGPSSDAGLAALREAATLEGEMPVEFGPPDVVKPTHELLGEVLLAAGRAADAQRAFERSLELQPGRSLSLRGLRRAAAAAGDAAAAERAATALRRNWVHADRDLPGLAEVTSR
jgi:tetratricopeptide (TPR) repeat protein